MKPGDMIEWVYKHSNKIVDKGEQLWSSTMSRRVPIDEPSLLISITKEHYTWLNSRGLFHARVDDMTKFAHALVVLPVVPRTVQIYQ